MDDNHSEEVSTPYELDIKKILAMTEEETDELLRQAESDPKIRLAFVRAVGGKDLNALRRINNKRNQPYYTDRHGREVMKAMDWMIEHNKGVEFPYALAPNLKPRTFQQRMMQARAYVCDLLDPSGKYKKFSNKFTINEGAEAIQFVLINENVPLVFRELKETSSFEDVEGAVLKFCIEGELDTKVELPHKSMLPLSLSESEILTIETLVTKYEFTRALVTSTKIVLYKAKVEGAK